jgi:Glycosyltransferase
MPVAEFSKMTESYKPKILILCDFYLPGYKSGGGLRTLVNTVERLGDDFDFHVICRDHDGWADRTPYKNVKINDWNRVGKASVFYLSKEKVGISEIKRLLRDLEPEAVYMNSFFSTLTIYALTLRKIGSVGRIPMIVAPEGELAEGALKLKSAKKKAFLMFAKASGLYENLLWKASSESEVSEVKKHMGKGGEVFYAPNLPPKRILPDYSQQDKPSKRKGELQMVFLSRIHPTKNLKYLLNLLHQVQGEVLLDVYGPFERAGYVEECKEVIKTLPHNVKVTLKGEVDHAEVAETLFGYHLFCLPTLGESLGHVIVEALSAGCPVLISDRTPWRELEKKRVGWDLPLESPEKWVEVVNYCLKMDETEYSEYSRNARKFAVEWLSDEGLENATRKVFERSLSKS